MAQTHTFEYLLAGKTIRVENRELTPVKAIRFHCIDCSGGSMAEVRDCKITTCPLWPFRLGRNPKRKQGENSTIDSTERENEDKN